MTKLIIRSAQGEETRDLPVGKLTIGRNPDNTLTLSAPTVSRAHAELDVRPDGVFLTDVGSSGGTFVADTKLLPNQPRQVAPGEEIRIGPFVLIYVADVPAEPPPPDDVGGEPQPEPERKPEPEPERKPERKPEREPAVAATQEVSVLSNGPLLADDLQPLRDMLALMPERSLTRYFVGVEGTASRYLRYLPGIFHENDFMGRYLQIFETIWEPQEWRIDHINMYFDPRTCPAPMLDWLAAWLDLTINPHWPEARRRRLLAEATDLYRWRGTRYGMTRMIEVCTGLTPDVSDDPAQPFVFRVRVQIPPDSDVDAALIEDLVRAHKPAHAGYVIEIV